MRRPRNTHAIQNRAREFNAPNTTRERPARTIGASRNQRRGNAGSLGNSSASSHRNGSPSTRTPNSERHRHQMQQQSHLTRGPIAEAGLAGPEKSPQSRCSVKSDQPKLSRLSPPTPCCEGVRSGDDHPRSGPSSAADPHQKSPAGPIRR